ncbi:hypothetical protein [Chroococcidiopsis sp.]|uniref:hypothetical protein n=1 Tax=Chroococcidiopsis sp. TaxID=3088168 RepID=UPI003F338F1E
MDTGEGEDKGDTGELRERNVAEEARNLKSLHPTPYTPSFPRSSLLIPLKIG